MKRYFKLNTTNEEERCQEYSGMDSYNPNGTILASKKCKRCHNYKGIDCDSIGHYVECSLKIK